MIIFKYLWLKSYLMNVDLLRGRRSAFPSEWTPFNRLNTITILLSIYLLSACSSVTPTQKTVLIISPDANWWKVREDSSFSSMKNDSSLGMNLPVQVVQNLAVVRRKMNADNLPRFVVAISDANEINAFAQLRDNQNYIIFTQGFLLKFGNDPDILATTLGHELAHHKLGHTVAGYKEERANNINILGQTVSALSNFFVPFSGLLVGNLVKGVGLSYSRDDERAADNLGMTWAINAGYSHCGSYRFASEMSQLKGQDNFTFLSTHPGSEERMDNANIFAMQKNIASCGS